MVFPEQRMAEAILFALHQSRIMDLEKNKKNDNQGIDCPAVSFLLPGHLWNQRDMQGSLD